MRSEVLGLAGRPEDALATYEEVVRRFGDAPEPALREPVARALVNRGATLGQVGRPEDALATYEEVVRRFGDAPESALRERVALALVNRGATLHQVGRPEEALAAYDEVVRRFGDAPEPALRERVALALVNRGATLHQVGRPEEALAAYDEVVRRFGDAPEPALREQVAQAFSDGASLLMVRSYQSPPDQVEILRAEARDRLLAAQAAHPGSGCYDLACLAGLGGQADEAVRWLQDGVVAGASFSQHQIAADRDFDSIRVSPVFAQFVQTLPA